MADSESYLEALPDAVVVVDAEGRIAYANPATERLARAGRDELAGRPLDDAVPLRDSAGNPLAYSIDERSYQVVPVLHGRPAAELGARDAITGDFLLDPEFLHLPERPDVAPLVLLD